MQKETTQQTCPVCGSGSIRKDYDNPETMFCCKQCGSDFLIDGEVILNARTIDRPEAYKNYSESEISKGSIPMDYENWLKPEQETKEGLHTQGANFETLHIGLATDDEDCQLINEMGEEILIIKSYPLKENAEKIIRAVNERQALLDEIKELKNRNNSLEINLAATKKLMELNEWASQETDIVSRVVVKYYYAEHMAQSGVEFLKDATRYIGSRNEALNEGRTWFQLVADYAKKVYFDKTTRF